MAKQYKETAEYLSNLKQYKKLAKKADRRMRELERFSRYDEFKSILDYSYKNAVRDINTWTPPGGKKKKPRWDRNIPADTRSLKAKIKDIEKFLSKPTSTITGIKKIYIKRTETINKKFGTNFTWQELAKFFEEGGLADKTFNKYGSKTTLTSIGKIQASADNITEKIKSGASINIVVDNIAIDSTINSLLSEHGKELAELIND